jgi:hypothetical protein
MSGKQTAVEWLAAELAGDLGPALGPELQRKYEQAIAMEREQIQEAYCEGLGYGTAHYIGDATDEEIDPANYYQRTYGKEVTDANR